MATAKPAPAAAAAPAAAPEPKSKKKLLILIAAIVLAAAASGGGVWFFLGNKASDSGQPKPVVIPPPVFAPMEAFTVNLQSEGAEQFLQTAFTLQVATQEDADGIKLYLPQARSRILLLLSSKQAADISTVEGKKKLAGEILAQMKLPFAPNAKPLKVTDVFFTSFVIQ